MQFDRVIKRGVEKNSTFKPKMLKYIIPIADLEI